ncbi:MAG: ATP-binding cassette domain-containing protein [Haliscomenobacter sp.]|nr:ATP-binding cassette domain-containing protein [Haliscomenobacter sp.]MBK9487605.1 ATP-binding cassette domain-containing protein [Haliscomenobacter sp.]
MDKLVSSLNCTLHLRDGQRSFELDVDFHLAAGELLALSGPSGSGKTSVLRILAGLESRAKGRLVFQGQVWQDHAQQIFLPPQQRSIGVVFQDYALFPNMNVRQNLHFALFKHESTALIDELLDVMDLQDLARAFPRELSGGQQQRVALARALVRRPKLLLLDEPLSALDTQMREHLQQYIQELHKRYALTTLLISHHPEEIQRLAQRVLVMEKGKIVGEAIPAEESKKGFQLRAIWMGAVDGMAQVQLGENMLRTVVKENEVFEIQVGQVVWIRMLSKDEFEILPEIT